MSSSDPQHINPGRSLFPDNHHDSNMFDAYPNYTGIPMGMAPDYAYQRDGMQNPIIEIPRGTGGGDVVIPEYWTLSTSQDPETLVWSYSVKWGLVAGVLPAVFDNDERSFTEEIPESAGDPKMVQVAVQFDLNVDLNAASYVMPTALPNALSLLDEADNPQTRSESITILAEDWDDLVFSSLEMPYEQEPRGKAAVPIGVLQEVDGPLPEDADPGDPPPKVWEVKYQILTQHIFGAYSPFDGMVIYR